MAALSNSPPSTTRPLTQNYGTISPGDEVCENLIQRIERIRFLDLNTFEGIATFTP